MKNFLIKVSIVLSTIFGYGIMICLFSGSLTFFAYVIAIIIGGDAAILICTFVSKSLFPAIIKIGNLLILIGLAAMYLKGEKGLTTPNKKAKSRR